MVETFGVPQRWNIFARELEDILKTRDLRLSHLDDRGVVLHREKVRRLQHSLKSPSHLTTLNPMEMERLIEMMKLTDTEQKLLLAALLATSVEMTLMDRVDAETALMAANDVFTILFAALRAQPGMAVAGIKGGSMTYEQDSFGDTFFSRALDFIDRGTLALHVSKNALSLQAQIIHAREAIDAFTQSLDLLKEVRSPNHESEDWRCWYDEATSGKLMAEGLCSSK